MKTLYKQIQESFTDRWMVSIVTHGSKPIFIFLDEEGIEIVVTRSGYRWKVTGTHDSCPDFQTIMFCSRRKLNGVIMLIISIVEDPFYGCPPRPEFFPFP